MDENKKTCEKKIKPYKEENEMEQNKNTQPAEVNENELSGVTGGGGKLPSPYKPILPILGSLATGLPGCIHGFNGRCDSIGTNVNGVLSSVKCQFYSEENGQGVCSYNGE